MHKTLLQSPLDASTLPRLEILFSFELIRIPTNNALVLCGVSQFMSLLMIIIDACASTNIFTRDAWSLYYCAPPLERGNVIPTIHDVTRRIDRDTKINRENAQKIWLAPLWIIIFTLIIFEMMLIQCNRCESAPNVLKWLVLHVALTTMTIGDDDSFSPRCYLDRSWRRCSVVALPWWYPHGSS